MSITDIVDREEESDPLNARFGRNHSSAEKMEASGENRHYCPYCDQQVQNDFTFCPACGKHIRSDM